MRNAISLRAVRDVRIGPTDSAIISGEDVSGVPSEVFVKLADIPSVAGPLLCCAAAAAGPSRPLQGTIIPGCHLPVMKWSVGRSNINGEPVLILDVSGGCQLTFQFPAQSAKECGEKLAKEGGALAPSPQTKLN
jgi:hypothetical protein